MYVCISGVDKYYNGITATIKTTTATNQTGIAILFTVAEDSILHFYLLINDQAFTS